MALPRTSADPEEKKKKLNAELANGRLAMTLGCQLKALQCFAKELDLVNLVLSML